MFKKKREKRRKKGRREIRKFIIRFALGCSLLSCRSGSQSVVPRAAVSVSANNMLELQILSPHPDLLNQKLWFWSEWFNQKWFESTLCFQISPPSDSEAGLSVTAISLRRSHSLGDDWVRNCHTTWFWSIIFERTAIQLLGKVCSFLKERHIKTWPLYIS